MITKEILMKIMYDYIDFGLIQKDSKKILTMLSDNIFGVGMGMQGFVSSAKQMRDLIDAAKCEISDATYSFEIEDMNINLPNEYCANISAKIIIFCDNGRNVTKSLLAQSLNLALVNNKWLISSFHASPLELSKESIEAYPMIFADDTLIQLQDSVQKQTFELLINSLSGGIISTYVRGDGKYPIHFVNQGMLDYLGYNYDEFYHKFGGNAIDIVCEIERDQVYKDIEKNLAHKIDYETRFRIEKKDGSLIWVLERNRFIYDSNGQSLIIAIYLDINEMVHMQTALQNQANILADQREELLAQNEQLIAQQSILENQASQLEKQSDELSAQNDELICQRDALEIKAHELTISEERFKVALSKTANIVFECDLGTNAIVLTATASNPTEYFTSVKNIQNTLIIGGVIEEAYVNKLNKAFDDIRGGNLQIECIIKVNYVNSNNEVNMKWHKVSMSGVCNSNDIPIKAIGIIENITKQKEAEIAYAREEQYRQTVLSNTMATYVINFSRKVFEDCQTQSNLLESINANDPYDMLFSAMPYIKLSVKHYREYRETFDLDNILKAFSRGINEFSLEYELLNFDTTTTWVETILRLVADIQTSEIKGFMYIMYIDQKKKDEISLHHKVELDPLTKLYNKEAIEKSVSNELRNKLSSQSGAFMMMDIDHFKEINDNFGHPYGDEVLMKVAFILTSSFRSIDIIGRIGGDEFCVYISEIDSKKRLEEIADLICFKMRSSIIMPDNTSVTCSIGITSCGGGRKTFAQVYKEADLALYTVKGNNRNGYAIY